MRSFERELKNLQPKLRREWWERELEDESIPLDEEE